MSLNVAKEFLKFRRKEIIKFANLGLGNIYDKKVFEPLLDVYFNYRYYNVDNDIVKKDIVFLLNKHLVEKAKELLNENKHVQDILFYFGFIYYFDNVVINDDYDGIANQVNDFRNKKLKIEKIDKNEIINILKDNKERIDKFFNSFDSKEFNVEVISTNNKNCFNSKVNHNVKIPKLYSEYAINKVYNSGIVAENKLFVNYYMISRNSVRDIYNLIYKKNYLVDLELSILEKKEKLNRILNIIDDDLLKDHVIIKIKLDDYLKNKDIIGDKISNGYKFALVLDKDYEVTSESDIMFSLFSNIMVNDNDLFNKIDDKSKLVRY